jgi:hypothetical protein
MAVLEERPADWLAIVADPWAPWVDPRGQEGKAGGSGGGGEEEMDWREMTVEDWVALVGEEPAGV